MPQETTTTTSSSCSVEQVVQSLDDLLIRLDATKATVHGFDTVAQAVELEGRCQRLQAHLKRFRECSSVEDETTQQDLQAFLTLLTDMKGFLSTLNEAKVAPSHRWHKWWEPHVGKYARPLDALSNRLNECTVNHLHHLWACTSEDQLEDNNDNGTPSFPPTLEELKLCPPVQSPVHDEITGWKATACSTSCSASFNARLSISNRSTGSTATTVSMDSSMRSGSSNSHDDTHTSWASSSNSTPIQWDFSPRPVTSNGWGSSGGAVRTRRDRQTQYAQTQVLRELSQDIPVKELRVVLAQLEAGDTSPAIVAGKATMMTIGYLGALMVSPLAMMTGLSAKEAIQQTPLEAAAVFCHYLIEFELVDGTVGTLENCVEDIFLYAGRSTRRQQHVVTTIPVLPGSSGAPDSLSRPLLLRDLIQFRNAQRQQPYRLWDNNCKHFVFQAVTSGQLFPKASNIQEEAVLEVFFALCQGCYVQQETFDLFTSSSYQPVTPKAAAKCLEDDDNDKSTDMEHSYSSLSIIKLDIDFGF